MSMFKIDPSVHLLCTKIRSTPLEAHELTMMANFPMVFTQLSLIERFVVNRALKYAKKKAREEGYKALLKALITDDLSSLYTLNQRSSPTVGLTTASSAALSSGSGGGGGIVKSYSVAYNSTTEK
jgi:hypothetical protein